MSARSNYLIIGAGNFGAATALSLAARSPTSSITLVDSAMFPSPRAASHDINKIVRDDYPHPVYMKLMLEGMKKWRYDPLYSPFYHQTGAMRADLSSFSEDCLAMYRKLGVETEAGWISVDEARNRWSRVFASSNFGELQRLFWNPRVGWAEAEQALARVVEEAVTKGVEYKVGSVAKLLFDEGGACIGAQLADGSEIRADVCLVAAGAGTAPLLYRSASSNKSLHVGDRAVATGAMSFFGRWDTERRQKFQDVPVLKVSVPGVKGEAMSLAKDGVIKFNCDLCFTNLQKQDDGTVLSVPPDGESQFTWTKEMPQKFKDIAQRTLHGLYGENANNVEIEGYRLCWDASTPTHDFLISGHPHSKNLYIATGGSFHGWKFLPVIGDHIVDMMEGTLDTTLADRWAFDKPPSFPGDKPMPSYVTSGDLADFFP
ncbi:sarcosine oxidase [Xylaria bambusicola]|uniref:sarcosine oxidase n=1 Tax=Xylaria bambusicola TaxID=326684 RepID=UPI002007D05F|nr:sarcosine oxidase [Xylaria bambusicola]KAI0523913.1 sarcosine oxidase [Xylaria bambusicola]